MTLPESNDRIAELESQCRSMRSLLGVIALTLVVVGTMGAVTEDPVSTVVRTRRFELLDDRGNTAMVIGTQNGSYPFLELQAPGTQGSGGRVRIEVPVHGGPAISLIGSDGVEKARFYLGAKLGARTGDAEKRLVVGQVPQLVYLDEHRNALATFGHGREGTAILEIRDSDGKVVLKLPRDE